MKSPGAELRYILDGFVPWTVEMIRNSSSPTSTLGSRSVLFFHGSVTRRVYLWLGTFNLGSGNYESPALEFWILYIAYSGTSSVILIVTLTKHEWKEDENFPGCVPGIAPRTIQHCEASVLGLSSGVLKFKMELCSKFAMDVTYTTCDPPKQRIMNILRIWGLSWMTWYSAQEL